MHAAVGCWMLHAISYSRNSELTAGAALLQGCNRPPMHTHRCGDAVIATAFAANTACRSRLAGREQLLGTTCFSKDGMGNRDCIDTQSGSYLKQTWCPKAVSQYFTSSTRAAWNASHASSGLHAYNHASEPHESWNLKHSKETNLMCIACM